MSLTHSDVGSPSTATPGMLALLLGNHKCQTSPRSIHHLHYCALFHNSWPATSSSNKSLNNPIPRWPTSQPNQMRTDQTRALRHHRNLRNPVRNLQRDQTTTTRPHHFQQGDQTSDQTTTTCPLHHLQPRDPTMTTTCLLHHRTIITHSLPTISRCF